jgi:hypothetical protein
MEQTYEIELHPLEELERNLSVDGVSQDGFMAPSANGFMAPSANGFMMPSASGFLVP